MLWLTRRWMKCSARRRLPTSGEKPSVAFTSKLKTRVFTYFPWMNDHSHVAFVIRGELSKTMNQRILLEKSIPIGIVHSHHELKIVDDDVLNVVNGDCIAHRL